MRRIIDICMCVLLLILMAYQATGETVHEWAGVAMTLLVVTHIILNRRWYGALFKGKYNPYRIATTAVNALLLLSFAMTAISGMAMSNHAVPFLYGILPASYARMMHLVMAHWSFLFMGIHLGLHIPAMTSGLKTAKRSGAVMTGLFCCLAFLGLVIFLRRGMADYMFLRTVFASFDYEKPGAPVFLENMLMMSLWAFIGERIAVLCRRTGRSKQERKELF